MVQTVLTEFPLLAPVAVFIGLIIATVLGYRTGRGAENNNRVATVSGATTIDSRVGDAVVMVLQDIATHQRVTADECRRIADAAEKALEQMSQTAADEATRALIDRQLRERLAEMQMENRKK